MKLSLLYLQATGNVVAACTRASASPGGNDLAMLVGAGVPVYTSPRKPEPTVVVLQSELKLVDLDADASSGDVLAAPLEYVVDPAKPTAVTSASAVVTFVSLKASTATLTFTVTAATQDRMAVAYVQGIDLPQQQFGPVLTSILAGQTSVPVTIGTTPTPTVGDTYAVVVFVPGCQTLATSTTAT
jgi:hypothetical protein